MMRSVKRDILKKNQNIDTEVVIIGAGIMGLSTAYYLVTKGVKNICLLENMPYIGGITTTKCAGGFRHQFNTKLNIELSKLNYYLTKCIEKDHGINLGIEHSGYFFLASNENDSLMLERAVYLQNQLGIQSQLIDKNYIQNKFSFLNCNNIKLGSVYQKDGLMDVTEITNFLLSQLKKNDISIINNIKVLKLLNDNNRITGVETSRGKIQASNIVIAAGSYSKEVANTVNIDLPTQQIPQQLFLTTKNKYADLLPVVVFLESGLGFHSQAGGILSGMTMKKNDAVKKGINHDWTFKHCEEAVKYFPDLINSKIISEWWGYYDSTPDANPIIGELPIKGLYCLSGFDGHGFMHGLAAGNIIASLIINGTFIDLDLKNACYKRFQIQDQSNFNSEIRI